MRIAFGHIIILFALTAISACKLSSPATSSSPPDTCHSLVNPFIGTGGHGHTYPGATSPFGMVQLSPDTRLNGWDGCSGYHYSDSAIYGFSHTHLQGTGVSDYGDILFMPTNGHTRKSARWNESWKSSFRHDSEKAIPGYYAVNLDDYGIRAELTTTPRTGVHRYTLAAGDTCRLFIDFMHRDELLYYDVRNYGDTAISGYRVSKGWAQEQHCYFYAVFSRPFAAMEQLMQREEIIDTVTGKRSEMWEEIQALSLLFIPESISAKNELIIRVGLSGVDEEGARNNLYAEAPSTSFDEYVAAAKNGWESTLTKCPLPVRKDLSRDEWVTYYTSLYHCHTVPHVWSDCDGRYRGMDNSIHTAVGYTRYTVFSLWDTFRAYHPLMCKLQPERSRDWIVTFLEMYKERGELPVWELAANETYCMIGYHSVPVIYDAWKRGIRDFDTQLALEAMVASARGPQREKVDFALMGFVPGDMHSESVSKTLEFAYDDWCIAQFAHEIGEIAIRDEFILRSQSWRHVFDPETAFMRPRINGGFPEPFDPYQVDHHYTEANAWQYSLFVPHDLDAFADYLGGKKELENWIDRLFEAPSQTTGRDQADITGLIGQYAHGNEPSHHVPFLYLYTDAAEKCGEVVNKICRTFYFNAPDGLCGNEDCGQMSAWYVCAMLGFYPILPGTDVTGFMNTTGNNGWSTTHYYSPDSKDEIWPFPIISGPQSTFRDSVLVKFRSALIDEPMVVRINDGAYKEVPESLPLYESSTIVACYSNRPEICASARFEKREDGRRVVVNSGYDAQYPAGGDDALVDGMTGGADYRAGRWQGYWKKPLEITVDLGQDMEIRNLALNCIQEIRPWIWMPSEVRYFISSDGLSFQSVGIAVNAVDVREEGPFIHPFRVTLPENQNRLARFVKVIALPAFSVIPEWHTGSGGQPWIFADELLINEK